MISRVFAGQKEGLTRTDVLDNITHYWLTKSGVSSSRIYWDNKYPFFASKGVTIPVAVSVFPDELYEAPPQLGRTGIPQPHPLQQAPQGRPLRRMGAAATVRQSCASGLPIAAVGGMPHPAGVDVARQSSPPGRAAQRGRGPTSIRQSRCPIGGARPDGGKRQEVWKGILMRGACRELPVLLGGHRCCHRRHDESLE